MLLNSQSIYRIYKLVIEFTKYLQNLKMPPKQKKVEEVMCLQVVVIDTPFNQENQKRVDRIGSLLFFPVQELKGVTTDQFYQGPAHSSQSEGVHGCVNFNRRQSQKP